MEWNCSQFILPYSYFRDFLPSISPGPIRDARVCAWQPDEDILGEVKEANRRYVQKLSEIAQLKGHTTPSTASISSSSSELVSPS